MLRRKSLSDLFALVKSPSQASELKSDEGNPRVRAKPGKGEKEYKVGASTFFTTQGERPSSNYPIPRKSLNSSDGPRFSSSPKTSKSHKIPQKEVNKIMKMSGLDEDSVFEKFSQFCTITDGKPLKGISEKQFLKFYKLSYPDSMNPAKLANSLFRLCDEDPKGNLDFREFVVTFCVSPSKVPTYQKFRTVFRIWDFQRQGYLQPGTFLAAMRDFYDILGLLSVQDHHRIAIELFHTMDGDGDCRVYEEEFVDILLKDPNMVRLMESCNFCVPHPKSYRSPAKLFS